jgi:hypothetical protein
VIKPGEIKSVEDIGFLDSNPVKMVRTLGGLWVATGKLAGKKNEEALAAGSHPAIVKHNIEKMYGNKFQPTLAKSESMNEDKVTEHTDQLEATLSNKGYSLHSIQSNDQVSFIVSNRGIEVLKHTALIKSESLVFQQPEPKSYAKSEELLKSNITKSIILAAVDKANEMGKTSISCKDIAYKVK